MPFCFPFGFAKSHYSKLQGVQLRFQRIFPSFAKHKSAKHPNLQWPRLQAHSHSRHVSLRRCSRSQTNEITIQCVVTGDGAVGKVGAAILTTFFCADAVSQDMSTHIIHDKCVPWRIYSHSVRTGDVGSHWEQAEQRC